MTAPRPSPARGRMPRFERTTLAAATESSASTARALHRVEPAPGREATAPPIAPRSVRLATARAIAPSGAVTASSARRGPRTRRGCRARARA
jgi:hypothetical protein